MYFAMSIICAISTFVIITDHLRIAAAANIPEENSNLERPKRQLYTTEYDYIDIDRLLTSERLVKHYINCLLDNGPCQKEGRELKKNLPDALKTDCSKCSNIQKVNGGKVLSFILQHYRDDWRLLVDKYDPEGIFRKRYGFEVDDAEDDEDDEGDEA